MDYKVLYRKYRPQNFEELVGQEHIKSLLLKSIIDDKLSHTYLFTGPRGTGKTSTAKLFAKIINCENSKEGIPCNRCSSCLCCNESADIIEIDAASNNGVDEIRELRDSVKILPTFSKYKVYIIDEVHMLSNSAWNAFLKTLEEPPQHVIFILATTEIQKVPITVLSRCQRFDFQRIPDEVLAEQISKIAKLEKISITQEAINEIVILAEGGSRDALNILDQLSKLGTKIDVDTITHSYGMLTRHEINCLLQALNDGKIQELIKKITEIQKNGVEAPILLNKILECLLNEIINFRISSEKKYPKIPKVEELILALESCYNKVNQYILIKTILVKHCPEPIQSSEIVPEKVEIVEPPIISREIIVTNNLIDISDEKLRIRINNAYVDATMALKKEFIPHWQNLIHFFTENNELKYLTLVQDSSVEVVSPTNIIVSTSYYSNSVLFNELATEIEQKLKSEFNVDKKIICLDIETWNKEKNNYIKNKKNKKYVYIPEPEIEKNNETLASAEDLFGNELVEIN